MTQSFSRKDFALSNRWGGGGNEDAYVEWVSRHAQSAAERFLAGEPVSGIVADFAKARHAFALKQGTPLAERFGAPRGLTAFTHLDRKNHDLIRRADRRLETLIHKTLPIPTIPPLPAAIPRLSRTISCRISGGSVVKATAVSRYLQPVRIPPHVFEPGAIVLEHTIPANITPLVDDCYRILETMRTETPLGEGGEARFSAAVFAYYHAMPFTRGSASIGQALFAGLHVALFERPLSALPPDIDLIALTALDADEFENDFVKWTRS